jgi:F-type H+-transporting ATPase subunit b
MPQLDFSSYAPQLIWLAITFAVLYLLMARVALPRIATVLEERRDRIASDLDEAEHSQKESQTALAAYEEALVNARSNAHEIARANRDKLNAEIDAKRAEIDTLAAEKATEAEHAIANAKSAAFGELGTVAGELTEIIVKQLVGGRIAQKKVTDAITITMKS